MINKRIKISICSILMAMLMFLGVSIVLQQKNTVYASGGNTATAKYIIDADGKPYQSNSVVGMATGSGDFTLGSQEKEISATAYHSYQLVGWNVIYDEQGGKEQFVDEETDTLTDKDGKEIGVTLTYLDENTDGYYDKGSFVLDEVFEDITVCPVFDYIYYDLDITDLVKYSSHDHTLTVNGDTIYYEDLQGNKYTKAYIKSSDKYLYLGDLYLVNGKYCTLHYTNASISKAEYIEYTKGAHRLGETLNISLDVDIVNGNFEASKNIEIVGFNSTYGESIVQFMQYDANDTTLQNRYSVQEDAYERAESYTLHNAKIYAADDYTNTIKIYTQNMYIANLDVTIDGATPIEYELTKYTNATIDGTTYANLYKRNGKYFTQESNVRNTVLVEDAGDMTYDSEETITYNDGIEILKAHNTKVLNAIKISDSKYLVRSSEHNGGLSLTVMLNSVISYETDGSTYNYYKFSSIDGSSNNSKVYSTIEENFDIVIDYTSIAYQVDFEINLLENGSLTPASDLGTYDSIGMLPGKVLTLDKSNADDFIAITGYQFEGYTFDDNITDYIGYEVDILKPSGTTIKLCYSKINYILTIQNLNKCVIGDLYAVQSITLARTRAGKTTNTTASSQAIDRDSNAYSFSGILNIGDSVKLNTIKNNGFIFRNYSFESYTDYLETNTYFDTLDLSADFIKTHAVGNEIVIYANEFFEYYTLTYQIDPTLDTKVNANVLMAGIEATIKNTTSTTTNIVKKDIDGLEISVDNNNTGSEVACIEISGLKYNDIITLTAEAKTVTVSATESYTYVFNLFTADDGKSELGKTESGGVYAHEAKITGDIDILVVYSMPNTKIRILVNKDFAEIVTPTISIALDKEGYNKISDTEYEDVAVGSVATITLSDINFGYRFIGYTAELSNGTFVRDDITGLTFNYPVNTEAIHTITLNFELITYTVNITQYGGGLSEANNTLTRTLDVSNLTIDFDKPVGYYISNTNVVKTIGAVSTEYPYAKMNESNDYRNNATNNKYSYTFELNEFVNIMTTYSTNDELGIDIYYTIYTYSVSIIYFVDNGSDSNLQFPTMTISLDGVTTSYDSQNKTLIFNGIPYGTEDIKFTVDRTMPTGLYGKGFTVVSDYNNFSQDLSYLSLTTGLTQDLEFRYILSYRTYTISYTIDGANGGAPEIYVNDKLSENSKISQGQSLEIRANADRKQGYKFSSIKYKNANGEEVTYTESDTFEDNSFNILDYFIIEKDSAEHIIFTIQYESITFTFTNIIKEEGKEDGQHSFSADAYFNATGIVIALSDYAKCTTPVSATISDKLHIDIQINADANGYDLRNGLVLKIVNIGGVDYTPTLSSLGNYYIDIAQMSVLLTAIYDSGASVEDDNDIDIYYYFTVQQKTLTVTTNIESKSFYTGDLAVTIQDMNWNRSSLGKKTSVSNSLQFLGSSVISYELKNSYKDVFKVTTLKLYDKNGTSLNADYTKNKGQEFAKYGIIYDTEEYTYQDFKTNIIKLSSGINVRYMQDLKLELQIEPIMYIRQNGQYQVITNTTYNIERDLLADNLGVAQEQSVDVDQSHIYPDIKAPQEIINAMSITYASREELAGLPRNAGTYVVTIGFNDTDSFGWFSELDLSCEILFTIHKKTLYIDKTTSIPTTTRIYNGSYTFGINENGVNLLQYLTFTDKEGLTIKYSDVLANYDPTVDSFLVQGGSAYITTGGKDGYIADANQIENEYYNLYIYGLELVNNSFTQNFDLNGDSVELENYIRITKKKLTISGLEVYNKVFDNTPNATLKSTDKILLLGKITTTEGVDDVSLNIDDLNVRFLDYNEGTDKDVEIISQNALQGTKSHNYYVDNSTVSGLTIYPYRRYVEIEGLGEVTVYNRVGLTDNTKVDLIPLNASLKVTPIYVDTKEYVDMYPIISKHLTNRKVYAIGYKLVLEVNGQERAIDHNLHIHLPNVSKLTDVYYIVGERSGALDYTMEDGRILISMSQLNQDITTVILLQQRALLKPWQIILIVVLVVLVILAIVITIVIVRKKKKERYSIHDKI